MKERTIYIVMNNDLMDYPPMISLIDIMCDLGKKVTYIGGYTESPTVSRFKSAGVHMIKHEWSRSGSILCKILKNQQYRNNLRRIFETQNVTSNDIIWYVYSETVNFVYDILQDYEYVIHYYEYARNKSKLKYRFLYPFYNQIDFVNKAKGVIHCEYNRAQVFRAINGMDVSPFVIPNKPYIKDDSMSENTIPTDVKTIIEKVRTKVDGKKVVLYQGYFDSNQRKLEEFCQAVNLMPSDYVMIAMGKGPGDYFGQLKKKYESDKIIFIPFILPPYHLYITELASVGVLTYSPSYQAFEGVINVLYCAPNKIFEYGRFGKPMISNNVPALKQIFNEYKCGEIIDYPITPEAIVKTLTKLFSFYNQYTSGARAYYDSVNLVQIVKEILDTI